MLKSWRVSIYTFIAVSVAIFIVGMLAVPILMDHLQGVYFRLQADVNQRQARAMTQFVANRLESGADPDVVIREFQATIEGSQTDRGYVCLIHQPNVEILCHSDHELLGMAVKPNAVFDRDFAGEGEVQWEELIRSGDSASGLLHVGPGMSPEIVYFNAVPGSEWTVSSHENAGRVYAEIGSLRRTLGVGAALFGLLLGIVSSWAARGVSIHHERQLQQQNELERKLLEAENARKTQELEEARQLQLSMLPKSVPDHPLFEIAAYMKTATEVGGDYYDFHLANDGTLTLVIGDATGHGAQAGVMVTATKSLFELLAEEADIAHILKKASAAVKRMALPGLYMALALGKLRSHTMELAGAGMPPALIHRAQSDEIEQISLAGLPLGSPLDFPYKKTRLEVSPGDTLVLMSDGLPELFSETGEMFGYNQPVATLREVAHGGVEEILQHFVETVTTWAGQRPPGDDVTFVVLRMKEANK